MRRFDYDDSDEKDEVDNMFNVDDDDDDDDGDDIPNISDAELEAMIEHHRHQEAINLMQVELAQTELDQRLLAQSIKMCERSWFWNFKSHLTQLKQIAKTYLALSRMIQNVKDHRQKEQ